MIQLSIRRGDKCWVQTHKKHYGVCVGFEPDGTPQFVHNTTTGGVVLASRKGFAGNRPINIEQHAAIGQEEAVAKRALSLVGREYRLLSFNCEHTANLAVNGVATSPQVQRAGLLSLLIAAVLGVVNNNGTSVGGDGRRRNGRGQFAKRRWI